MKKFYTILCIAIASLTQLQAQAPQGFNYQATVRNSSGDLIINTNVYFQFNVIQGSQTAVPIFTETHYVPTDDLGQVNLVIGQGTANTGVFSELDWSLGSYYLGIELDTGNGYVAMGTTQLLSVPYALYAENSGGTSELPSVGAEGQVLSVVNGVPTWVDFEALSPCGDESFTQTWYIDADADGYGFSSGTSCIRPENGFLLNELSGNGIDDCDDNDDNEYPGQTWYIDADGDGYGTLSQTSCIRPENGFLLNELLGNGTDDCDDSNSNTNPGSDEVCDNIDNNCNAEVDENPVDVTTWYVDADGDGYGFIQISVVACSQPDGYVSNSDDCDDSNSNTNPGSDEVCDNIDNNCNAEVDENPVDGTTWYVDSDGDGYGFIQISVVACSQPEGYVANSGDCDDSNTSVHANAIEIEDGIDNDCDGSVDEGSGSVTDQDGNTYGYLTYGDQVWTVEDFKTITYRDGTPIPQVTEMNEWDTLSTGAWCYYDNDPTKPRLYNWFAVMGIHDTDPNTPNKEFAPEGWHIPSDTEWTTFENYLISNGYNYDGTTAENKIAKAMASTTGWNSSTNLGAPGNDQSLNNDSEFNAVPEGLRYSAGSFNNEGFSAFFWSSTGFSTAYAWNRNLNNQFSYLNRANGIASMSKRDGFSVRFVRD